MPKNLSNFSFDIVSLRIDKCKGHNRATCYQVSMANGHVELHLFCRVLDRKSFLEVEVLSSIKCKYIRSVWKLSLPVNRGLRRGLVGIALGKDFFHARQQSPFALQIHDQMVSSLPEHVQIWLEIRLQTNCHLRLDFNLTTSLTSRPPPRSPPGLTCRQC